MLDLSLSFHTFRQRKATTEYHKTKDILHVMKLLVHKNINNTLVYTQLVDFEDDEYTVRVAHSVEEDKQLIEAGFSMSPKETASRSTENASNLHQKVGRVH